MSVRRRVAGALALCCALLAGCQGAATEDPARGQAQHLLDARARAVLDHDRTAYLATEDPRAADRGEEFTNLRAVPLAAWSYRLTRYEETGRDTARVRAELGYRLSGYDRSPVRTDRAFELRRREGRWYVVDERPADRDRDMFWEQGEVGVVRGARSLVLGEGRQGGQLRDYARLADEAVPRVTEAWGEGWQRRVIVLVPGSLDEMAGLLGAEPSAYQGIAAVTTGENAGSGKTPADRVIINPDAFAQLGDTGKRVVMTHEITHVATRSHTGEATPLWLSEGFADWSGYRDSGRDPRSAAPELARAVREGRVPRTLPADLDFTFGREPTGLSEAYEGAWLACRMIADQWDEERLRALYREVDTYERSKEAVSASLRKVLGVDEGEFTRRWRAYLRTELGQ
ncbi:hypothetical protein HUT18_06145 [Streptomyces sp. NA04227]|uniref:hypothetical protein n=1 Tax=Streptomyces sp. NA04227 TaxID=2742136 RepID=UPI0015900604|nr:hypothetical protein [Streptomyces sp. NA04227]QKW06040.1 hypothetical protein HUT18_06145 [Streptomyces sp. NA04227]